MTSLVTAGPLLDNGDHMDAGEFMRRYALCEEAHRIELIEGVVYMPSPIRTLGHAREQGLVLEWLIAYARTRVEVEYSPPATVRLDDENVPEPDAMLYWLRPGRIDEDGYLAGPPELIVEIAASSVSRDLHQKRRAYERAGVLEYVVWRTQDKAVDWFRLQDGSYVRVEPGADGVIESGTFPGLRMNVPAMLAGDRSHLRG